MQSQHTFKLISYDIYDSFLGYKFVSQTDTEIIAKMIKYMYDCHPKSSFSELVEMTVKELEGKVFPKINRGR